MLHLLLRVKLFTTESQVWICSEPLYTWHAENFVFHFWSPLHYSGFILPAFPERRQAWESVWRSLLPLFWYPWLLLLSWGNPNSSGCLPSCCVLQQFSVSLAAPAFLPSAFRYVSYSRAGGHSSFLQNTVISFPEHTKLVGWG